MPINDLIKLIVDSGQASAIIIVVILFLKYIRSRDQKDIQTQTDNQQAIRDIVKTHDERIAALLRIHKLE